LTSESNQPDITLDFRSLRCPKLLITVIKEIENAKPGQVLQITASDLNAPSSISSWTRQSEHELLDMIQEGDDFVFVLLRQPLINNQPITANTQPLTTDH
jgi:TusA-related sulfurtransferase